LTKLKALNLSNTCVTSNALKFFSGLLKLQSLALYGCRDIIDSPDLDSLQSELPSLRCLRLNIDTNEDGVINHDSSDSEEDGIEEDDDDTNLTEPGNQEFPYHSFGSEESDEDIDDFEDAQAHQEQNELESLDAVMDDDLSSEEEDEI
jgi:hypothetical protein